MILSVFFLTVIVCAGTEPHTAIEIVHLPEFERFKFSHISLHEYPIYINHKRLYFSPNDIKQIKQSDVARGTGIRVE